MISDTELHSQLSNNEPDTSLFAEICGPDEFYIVVFKNYKFYKKLSIEIYIATTTKSGKIKNPLRHVNPLDLAMRYNKPDELKFFAAVSRFQNDPTAARSSNHIKALKVIVTNPMKLRCFFHDSGFSENVVAGALTEISFGSVVSEMIIHVHKRNEHFLLLPEINGNGNPASTKEFVQRYDYFLQSHKDVHLLGGLPLLQLFRFFEQHPEGLVLNLKDFEAFRERSLKPGQYINMVYHGIPVVDTKQIDETTLAYPERIIYLSDLDSYVIINPVMKYGAAEVPVLSKRNYYSKGSDGNLQIINRDDNAEIRFTALLLKQHEDFEDQLDNDLTHFYLHKQRFLDENWFLRTFDEWRSAGITVLGFNQLKGNKFNSNKANINIQVLSGLNWFNTAIDVRFGKTKASLKQIHQSVRNKSRFIPLDDGTMGILPEEWLQKFELFFKNAEIDIASLRIPKSNYASVKATYNEEFLTQDVRDEIMDFERSLSTFEGMKEVDPPKELKTTLRDYQKQGLNWLNLMDDFNFGSCLADDMGLGKTVQIIAFILTQRFKVTNNTNLVVVPTSLLFNWQEEIRKFAPSINVLTFHGPTREKTTAIFKESEVVLTTYGTVISDVDLLSGFQFNYIFLDESQNIKNVESQRYYAVKQLQSRNKIVITGTPIENNTLDLYAQLSFACPGLLGSKQAFKDLFSIPIDRFKSSRNAVTLRDKVAPFILRRTKQQVAQELPGKTEMTIYCPMQEPQRKVYDAYEKEFRDFISGITEDQLMKNSAHVLRGLTRLRQICDSPLLLKDERLYSDRSSKIDTLIDQIQNKAPSHKILVFSQFVSMLNLIRIELDKSGISYEYLTGATRNRKAVVDDFQDNHSKRVFLISLKAGGTGLNLTAADYVYLVDPWWNPAVENQAIDRSYRLGQKNNVVAVRLICPGTLEDKISQLQLSKKMLSDDLIKTDLNPLKQLTRNDLLNMLQP